MGKRMVLRVCVAAALAFLPGLAAAQVCGEYASQDLEVRYVFNNDGTGQAYRTTSGSEGAGSVFTTRLQHHFKGGTLYVQDVETLLRKFFVMKQQGAQLHNEDLPSAPPLLARQNYTCPTLPALQHLALPVCGVYQLEKCCARGDFNACIRSMEKDPVHIQKLRTYCPRSPRACLVLLDAYAVKANPLDGDLTEIPGIHTLKKPLPAAQLDEMAQMCEKHMTPQLCDKAINQLWLGERWQPAIALLEKACNAQIDIQTCRELPNLRKVQFPANVRSQRDFPCGIYTSASVKKSTINIGDRARVLDEKGKATSTARLEDGLVRIRNKDGDDLVYIMPNAHTLITLGNFSGMETYVRSQTPANACTPPVTYDEVPLSKGCGMNKDPATCCAAGDSQGCNILGNMAAMRAKPDEALRYFTQVCAAKVRSGCENMVNSIAQTGKAAETKQAMQAICAQDPKRTHVACDVLETGAFDAKAAEHAIFKEL